MKQLTDIFHKVHTKATLDKKDVLLSQMPLYKIIGYKDIEQCVKNVKKNLITKQL